MLLRMIEVSGQFGFELEKLSRIKPRIGIKSSM